MARPIVIDALSAYKNESSSLLADEGLGQKDLTVSFIFRPGETETWWPNYAGITNSGG
jgi:hypothetical protein